MDIRRVCTAVAFVLLGGCSFKASCGGTKLNTKKAEEFLAGVVEKEAGVAPTKVDCPADVPIEKGNTFTCEVEVAGVAGRFTLLQEDDSGYVTVQSAKGLLVTNKLETTIAEGIKQQAGVDAKVDCGPRVHASKPGATLSCRATDSTGQAKDISVAIKDEVGNVSWQVGPGSP